MLPLLIRSNHTKAEGSEQPEHEDDDSVERRVETPLCGLRQSARTPVYAETESQDCEVECWVVVVNVCHTCHCNERQVVKEPSDRWVYAGVLELIEVFPCELVEASLPADGIPCEHADEEEERRGRCPVDEGVAKKEVLDDVIVPTAHAETDVKKWPLPWLRSEIVLLVWVWHKRVVRGHHGDVEMDEVAEERRFI